MGSALTLLLSVGVNSLGQHRGDVELALDHEVFVGRQTLVGGWH